MRFIYTSSKKKKIILFLLKPEKCKSYKGCLIDEKRAVYMRLDPVILQCNVDVSDIYLPFKD